MHPPRLTSKKRYGMALGGVRSGLRMFIYYVARMMDVL
jgi:hypothetical protein